MVLFVRGFSRCKLLAAVERLLGLWGLPCGDAMRGGFGRTVLCWTMYRSVFHAGAGKFYARRFWVGQSLARRLLARLLVRRQKIILKKF